MYSKLKKGADLFSGKSALITGGSEGIGFATAKKLIEQGAERVFITGRDKSKLDKAVECLGDKVSAIVSDASDIKSVEGLFDSKKLPKVDLVVLNAGIAEVERITALTEESVIRQFATNVFGPMFAVQQALKQERLNPGAAIILISSAAATAGAAIEGLSVYSATKAAVNRFVMCAAVECAKHPTGTRVMAIAPGHIDTPLNRKNNADQLDAINERTLAGRRGEPEEVADAVLYAASLPFATGQTWTLDGGITLQAKL